MRRLTKSMTIAVLAMAGIGAVACGAAHPAASGAARSSLSRDAVGGAVKGHVFTSATTSCRPSDVAAVAVVRAGTSQAALARLAPRPLATLTDARSGELAFFHPATMAAANNTALFRKPAELVPAAPKLQSCDYLLRDRPAAQPFIRAAISAAVTRGLARSAASLRGKLEMTEIGVNPLAPGSLVVTLLLNGPRTGSVAGHAIYASYRPIFVVLNQGSRHVTGAGAGTTW
jgi:hypothetical protein